MPDIPELPADGERLTTECLGPIVSEHMHRYAIANHYTKGKDVIDIACGEGYGSNYLSAHARSVIGVDISSKAITHAQAKYQRSNLAFVVGDCTTIPVPDHSVDVVVSFETLEHIVEHDVFFSEIKRILRSDGILVISTPDKMNYSEIKKFRNPFHVKELYHKQFQALVRKYFKNALYGRQIYQGASIIGFTSGLMLEAASGDYVNIDYKNVSRDGIYSIAIASDVTLKKPKSSVFQFTTNIAQAPSRYVRCEVYISNDGNFVADKSEAVNVQSGQAAVIRFKELQKHATNGMVYLRIDPIERIGTFRISRAALCFSNKSDLEQHRDEIDVNKGIISTANCLRVDDNSAHYIALNDDPQLSLIPFNWDGTSDWWLELEICISLDLPDVANLKARMTAHVKELEAAVGQRDQIVAAKSRDIDALHAAQLTLTARISELESSLNNALIRNDKENCDRLEQHGRELANLKTELSSLLKKAQDALLAEHEELAAQNNELKKQVEFVTLQSKQQLLDSEMRHSRELAEAGRQFSDLHNNAQQALKIAQAERSQEWQEYNRDLVNLRDQCSDLTAIVKKLEKARDLLIIENDQIRNTHQLEIERLGGLHENAKKVLADERLLWQIEREQMCSDLQACELAKKNAEAEIARLQRQLSEDAAKHVLESNEKTAQFGILLAERENELIAKMQATQHEAVEYKKNLEQTEERLALEKNAHQQTLSQLTLIMSLHINSFFWKIQSVWHSVRTFFGRIIFGKKHTNVIRAMQAVSSLFHYNLEKPASKRYQKSENPVIVEGWCIDKAGNPAMQVRVRLGQRTIICDKIDRPDVANYFKDSYALPLSTGFRAEFKTGTGLKYLRIEACMQSGQWACIATRLLKVGDYVTLGQKLAMPGDDEAWPTEPDVTPAAVPDVKAIAFYLPQFHPIPENNRWWGEGFTEWTNVRHAQPQFPGHYQPHEPVAELGYYDILDSDIMKKQAGMARAAGIYGFCYYYYWFGGKRLLEKPLERMLQSGSPDMPFCYCWANENWSRRWDGQDAEILIAQNHSAEDDMAIINDFARAFQDKRYIRVNGMPLLIVYRPALLPEPSATFARWRSVCRKLGLGEIHIAGVKGFGCAEPLSFGLDALIEFPPNDSGVAPRTSEIAGVPPRFDGKIYDIREVRANWTKTGQQDFTFYRGVAPSWDNTARRKTAGSIFMNSSPGVYYNWLRQAVEFTRKNLPDGQRILFINAWNEWAEGCHLEPDKKYGYAWLNATRKALGSHPSGGQPVLPFSRASDGIVMHHESHEQPSTSANSVGTNQPRQSMALVNIPNIQAPELRACPLIVISVLFYYREELIYNFLDNIIPQARDLLAKHDCRCDIVLLLNYPALATTLARIDEIVGGSPPHPRLSVIVRNLGYNSGFGLGHNMNFKEHDSDIFILINSDLRVNKHDWLSDVLACANTAPRPALIGPASAAARLREDGCGIDAPNPLVEGFDFVDGSLIAVNSAVARRIGLFNESIRYFYFEDSDLCLRYRQAGYQIALMDIKTHHARSVSARLLPRSLVKGVLDHNRFRFFALWGGFLANRFLSNRLALVFSTQNPDVQLAALPAIMGLLADHPTAVLDIGGVTPLLRDIYKHKRIDNRPSRRIRASRAVYHRYYEIGLADGDDSLMARIACCIESEPRIADAAAHIRSLVGNNISGANRIMVCVAQPSPLRAGSRPGIDAWRALVSALSARHGGNLKILADMAVCDVPANWKPHATLASDDVLGVIRDFSGAACVVATEHWTLQLAQLLGVKTLAWLGSTPARVAIWAWASTGVFSARSLDCLGCSLNMGAPSGNICLRGDENCMAAGHARTLANMVADFIKPGAIGCSWHIAAWKPALLDGPKLKSEQLDLGSWRENIISSVLIVVFGRASDAAKSAAVAVAESIPCSKAVFCDHPLDSTDATDFITSSLNDEKWVFCVESSVRDYHEKLLADLAMHAELGIAAPFVVEHIARKPLDATKARAVCDQFMDAEPCEVIQDLAVARICYIANADIFRHAKQHHGNMTPNTSIRSIARLNSNVLTDTGILSDTSNATQSDLCHYVLANNLTIRLATGLIVVATRTDT